MFFVKNSLSGDSFNSRQRYKRLQKDNIIRNYVCLLEEIRSLKSALAATTLSFSNALLQQNFELQLQALTFLQHECCLYNYFTTLIEPGLKPLRPKTVCASYLATTPRKHCTSGQWFESHAYLAPQSSPAASRRFQDMRAWCFLFLICSKMFSNVSHDFTFI